MGESDESLSGENEIKEFFLQEKPSDMIVLLRKQGTSYAGELSESANTTYSHAVKVMNRMKEAGLVQCSKRGRKKEYRLTKKGACIADSLESMMEEIDGMESPEHEKEEGIELQ